MILHPLNLAESPPKESISLSIMESYTYLWRGSWRHVPKQDEQGAQIDLLIDRADGIINLCEIKYCQGQYNLSKKYANELLKKVSTFQTQEKISKTIFITLITPDGAEKNPAFEETIVNEITLSDLFRT